MSNGLGGDTFTRNVTGAHTDRLWYEINICRFFFFFLNAGITNDAYYYIIKI